MSFIGRIASRLLVSAAALAAACGSASAATELTMSSWLPPGYFLVTDAMKPWAESIERETQGRVKVTILPAPIGKPAGAFDVAREGQADITYGIHGYQPGRFELSKAVEMPFVGDNAEAISAAYWRIYKKHFEKAAEHRGVQVLGVFTHTPGHIMHATRPMATIDDLRGQKMRVGGGVVNDTAQALGMSPLLHPASEVYQILSNGVADGVLFTLDSIEGFKLTNVVKHVTVIPGGLYNSSFFLVMNQAKFRGLPKEDQEAVMRVSGEAFSRLAGRAFDKANARAMDHVKANNIQLVTASDTMIQGIRERTAPIEANWIQAAAKKGVDGKAVLSELRAEISAIQGGAK
ncbi:TRAP transporter substrate-binding protein [Arenibaculum pallidiluteum]|uniref:TRAP transporter substrate-binding protein n=1 Tax=Arenibaculum pallidiluteum TaxID=2812559 RepID=UPI001A9568D5|nr:TRAP transporter substrate-binding protein [Arenibaculum pallidiluteum]